MAATYTSALNKINEVKNEVNDGANTATRVGLAMKEMLDHAKGVGENADAAILAEQIRAQEEEAKKPDLLDLATFDTTQPLPLGKSYVYNSIPVQSVYGARNDGGNYVAFSIGHENNDGYEAYNHDVMLFLSEASNPNIFMYSSTFNTGEDSLTGDEDTAAMALGAGLATISRAGLMSEQDKVNMNALLTEVFPVKVAVVSSNAGTREIGTSVTPVIEISITRKGSDVAASSEVSVSPDDGSLSQNKKTYTGASISSGSKTYQIGVAQGGQTANIPNQVFSFLNYRYYGVVSSAPANAAAVKTLCQNGTLSKQLSSYTTLGDTELAANKYYVFVVPNTNVSLVVKNAKSGNTINGCTVGTVEIPRVNNSANVNYKYVIVPASSISWTFKITNS